MLISVDSGKVATKLPHQNDFIRWRKNISDEDYEKVVDAINELIDANDINTAGWMPGNDWTGTPYEAISSKGRYKLCYNYCFPYQRLRYSTIYS